jgi:hypothetical protein
MFFLSKYICTGLIILPVDLYIRKPFEYPEYDSADHNGRAVFARSNTGIVSSNPT